MMFSDKKHADKSTALFVDMEFFIRIAQEQNLPVELKPVVERLLTRGRVSLLRGFGDLYSACRGEGGCIGQVRRMLYQNHVQFEDVLSIKGLRSTVDMRMALEAVSVAQSRPDIGAFCIIGGDQDFLPLVAKLRELGKYTIGVGPTPEGTNETYVSAYDEFFYYASLYKEEAAAGGDLMEKYLALLANAVASLKRNGHEADTAAALRLMRKWRPDFDLRLLGMGDFKELLDEAQSRDLVAGEGEGRLMLKGSVPPMPSRRSDYIPPAGAGGSQHHGPSAAASHGHGGGGGYGAAQQQASPPVPPQQVDADTYLNFFERKLKCSLPPRETRMRIYERSDEIITEEARVVSISVSELSDRISAELRNVEENAAFKLLYSLFRARTFDTELGFEPYNPRIKRAFYPVPQWDRRFILNSLKVLKLERPEWPLKESALAEVFEIEEEEIKDILREITGGE